MVGCDCRLLLHFEDDAQLGRTGMVQPCIGLCEDLHNQPNLCRTQQVH